MVEKRQLVLLVAVFVFFFVISVLYLLPFRFALSLVIVAVTLLPAAHPCSQQYGINSALSNNCYRCCLKLRVFYRICLPFLHRQHTHTHTYTSAYIWLISCLKFFSAVILFITSNYLKSNFLYFSTHLPHIILLWPRQAAWGKNQLTATHTLPLMKCALDNNSITYAWLADSDIILTTAPTTIKSPNRKQQEQSRSNHKIYFNQKLTRVCARNTCKKKVDEKIKINWIRANNQRTQRKQKT